MITEISKTGFLKCSACGASVEVEVGIMSTYGICQCGARISGKHPHGHVSDVFALFGYGLSIDWDGALTVESSEPVPQAVIDWLFSHQSMIRSAIEFTGKRAQRVYIGGELNGRPHGEHGWKGKRVIRNIGRKHWEVYNFRGH